MGQWLLSIAVFVALGSLCAVAAPTAHVDLGWVELEHQDAGWRVTSIHEHGNWTVPLKSGDLLVQIDRLEVSKLNPLSVASLLYDAYFRRLTLLVQRDSQAQEVEVFTGALENSEYVTQFYRKYGIGISIYRPKDLPVVKLGDAIEGGPAAKAGLKDGDELLAVDGKEVVGLPLKQVAEMLIADHASPVRLRLRRESGPLEVTVERAATGQLYKELQPAATAFPMQTGPDAPGFRLPDLDGTQVSLDDFRGRWVLLSFWATWCPPCVREAPLLARLAGDYAAKLAVLALDVDDKQEDVHHFVAQTAPRYTVLMAGKLDDGPARAYNVRGIPLNVVVSPEGKVVYLETGFGSSLESYVRAAVGTTAERPK